MTARSQPDRTQHEPTRHEPTRYPARPAPRRRLVAAGAAAAAVAVVAGGAAIAATAGSSEPPAAAPVTQTQSVDAVQAADLSHMTDLPFLDQLPEELRQDLEAAAQLPEGSEAQQQALQSVATKAMTGAYGAQAQEAASHLVAAAQQLPAGLLDRLREVASAPLDQRADEIESLLADAGDGRYGEEPQQAAQRLRLVPADLRERVLALAETPATERGDAVAELGRDALSGQFGTQLQAGLEQLDRRLQAAGEQGLAQQLDALDD